MTLRFSFEVFPPKTEAGLATLAATTKALLDAQPEYISVTYGAGGGTQDRSFAAINAVHQQAEATEIAAHLTCVGQSISEIEAIIDRYATMGVTRVVALRGDPPTGIDADYSPHPEGFASTASLVSAIKSRGDFWVAVSAYPELHHPQSPNLDHDLDLLEAKVAAGADAAMTQMFFDNAFYFDYLEAVRARGIDIDIIPGVFPIHSFEGVSRFASKCGASIPDSIAARFTPDQSSAEAFDAAVSAAADQIDDLVAHGVDRVHVYTLNRPELALAVCDAVGARR